MALKITLKANEAVIVNGCVIRNSDRRHVLLIENKADVVRGQDLLNEDSAATPVKRVYFLIQTALVRPETREKIVPVIQTALAELVSVFAPPTVNRIFEAAQFVSTKDYYKALSALRSVMRYEQQVFNRLIARRTTSTGYDEDNTSNARHTVVAK